MKINIDPSWNDCLQDEVDKEYFKELLTKINTLYSSKTVYPPKQDIFNAFHVTPRDDLKVVIIGQDPYHGEEQAHGLCFSVRKGIKIPPSLKNIYKELKNEFGYEIPEHGDLTSWAQQGVLLLNSVLTVEKGQAASHRNIGWETFTDHVVKWINDNTQNTIFMLWGNDAKKKGKNIDRARHLVLESGHPSPLSVRFFRGNAHFSKANTFLKKIGKKPIKWQIH
jgi:uracil-DNA glycosylase